MIERLRAFFRRDRRDEANAAPIGDLVLVISRRRHRVARGSVLARTKIKRWRVSLRENGGPPPEAKLDAMLDQVVPSLDRKSRKQLFEFVYAQALPRLEQPGALSLSHGLRALRDHLDSDLPGLPRELWDPPLVVVDDIVALDERRFWVFGWARDADGTPSEVTLIAPEGHRVRVLPGSPRFERADVAESLRASGVQEPRDNGFAQHFELDAPSLAGEGWLVELSTPRGLAYRFVGPPVEREPRSARGTMIWPFTADGPQIEELRSEHAFPALRLLQERGAESVEIDREIEYGSVPQAPDISVIVPLYRRIDLIEHQLAQFWRDPDFADKELIYVLDSPERADDLIQLAAPLHQLYGLPFRVLMLNRNGGYAVANNLAAVRARGRLLVLLNSDVLPVGPGWLGRMQSFYDATPEVGAIGPKLLYEDDSIQHAGMYFQRDAATRLWENQHYFKGFARSLPAANVSRPVPGVTGACMMIASDLFASLGGFSTVYVEGGYEDSDLCIRIAEKGLRNWYLADVELYHLEAQSFFIHARLANPCNAWIQTNLWNDQIEAIMSTAPEASSKPMAAVS